MTAHHFSGKAFLLFPHPPLFEVVMLRFDSPLILPAIGSAIAMPLDGFSAIYFVTIRFNYVMIFYGLVWNRAAQSRRAPD